MATGDSADRLDLQYYYYKGSSAKSRYVRNNGLLVIPVMGPAGTAPILVRTHAPYGARETDFEYMKQGSPPVFPSPEDTKTGDILLSSTVEIPAPVTSQQGGLLYAIRGHHAYVQPLGGRSQGDTFPIDAHPFPTRIDTLGQEITELTNPEDLIAYGQWTKNGITTADLTSNTIIG